MNKKWVVTREYEQDTDDEGREIAPPVPTYYVVTDCHYTAFSFKNEREANELCNLLNVEVEMCNSLDESREEIKRLSEENYELRKQRYGLYGSIADLYTKNEQLKKQITVYQKFLECNDLKIDWNELCTATKCEQDERVSCKECRYMRWINENEI